MDKNFTKSEEISFNFNPFAIRAVLKSIFILNSIHFHHATADFISHSVSCYYKNKMAPDSLDLCDFFGLQRHFLSNLLVNLLTN